jgi:hypothetical protein
MRTALISCAILLVGVPSARSKDTGATHDDMPSKIIEREHAVAKELEHFHPIVETYVQVMKSRQGEFFPWYDRHFVSLAEFAGGLRALRFAPRNSEVWRDVKEYSESFNPKILEYDPSGFVAMAYPDPSTFDLQHYRFQYLNDEFLGEIRCKVFQVTPSTLRKQGLFEGKIWVEDQNLTIIRFNGIYKGSNIAAKYFHFDSRRVSTKPGLWLPSTIDSEEPQLPCCGAWKINWTRIHVKTQTTFWGYDLRNSGSREELTSVSFDGQSSIRDRSNSSDTLGPLDQKRLWDRQAEDNVTARLEHIGLLSPSGDIEKTLATIVKRIEDANGLSPDFEVRCRILLTSNLESAVVGNTIILSRGLLDVAPDESVLAAILAHDLAHVALGDSDASNFSWPDQTRFGPRDIMRRLHFAHSAEQEAQASLRAKEWLLNSGYRDSLEAVAQFAAELQRQAPHIRTLLEASIGESLSVTLGVDHLPSAPSQVQDVTEAHALPLGARIRIDPWTGEATFAQPTETTLSAKSAKISLENSLLAQNVFLPRSEASFLNTSTPQK